MKKKRFFLLLTQYGNTIHTLLHKKIDKNVNLNFKLEKMGNPTQQKTIQKKKMTVFYIENVEK